MQLSPGQIDRLAIGNGWVVEVGKVSGQISLFRHECTSAVICQAAAIVPPPPCVTPLSLLLLLLLLLPHLGSHLSKGWRMNYSNLCPLITPSPAAASRPTGKTFLTAFFRPFFARRGEWGRNLGINFWACEEAGGRVGQTNY